MGEEALQHFMSLGLVSILLMLAPLLSYLVKLPPSIAEILLGLCVASFGWLSPDDSVFFVLAKMGFFFLMFLAGMEIDLTYFRKLGISFAKRAIVYFATTYCLATLVVFNCGYPPFYIIVFPVMSVGMIVALLKYYGKDQIWLNTALQIGILGEFLSIIALVVVNGFYTLGFTFELYKSLMFFVGFLLLISLVFACVRVIFWWFPSLRLVFIPRQIQMNEDIRFAMMLFFVFIAIVLYLKIDVILGAFFAGLVLANFFQYDQNLPKKLHDVGFGFFIPLFFVYVGSTLDVQIILENAYLFHHALQLMGIMFCLHFCAHLLANRRFFGDLLTLILSAFSSCVPLTFLVATATLGKSIGALQEIEYYTFVIAAVSEGVFFVLVIKILNLWRKPTQKDSLK